mmetsp:Transcript_6291/g.17086  ORF Transcript_6291/g.17086 Transcript_6291/m.17086 type:complete len:82 (+) Transcript_6291:37-282(+)
MVFFIDQLGYGDGHTVTTARNGGVNPISLEAAMVVLEYKRNVDDDSSIAADVAAVAVAVLPLRGVPQSTPRMGRWRARWSK